MNGYRNIKPLQPPDPVAPVEQEGFSEGYRGDADPSMIPLDASPALSDVRIDEHMLRRDWGFSSLGVAAENTILGMQEHKYILHETLVQRIARAFIGPDNTAVVELWEGAAWSRRIDSEERINDALLSTASVQGSVVFANGTKILELVEQPQEVLGGNDFAADNEIAEGETTAAIVSPAGALGNKYNINYGVTVLGPSTTGVTVVIGFLRNAVEFEEKTYLSNASADPLFEQEWPEETLEYEGEVEDGDEFQITVKSISGTSNAGTIIALEDSTLAPTPCLFGEKTDSDEPLDSKYEFKASFNLPAANPGAFEVSRVDITFYKDVGAGFAVIDAKSFYAAGSAAELINISHEVVEAGLVAGNKLGMRWEVVKGGDSSAGAYCGVEIVTAQVEYFLTTGATSFSASVRGERTASGSTRLGVSYLRLSEPIITFAELSADAPAATFVFAFADRLLALRDGIDNQSLAWSISGNIRDWVGVGSGQLFLVDSRSDPIDELMGAAILSENVAVLIRRRSIMRIIQTGNIDQSIGALQWIDHLGTDAAHSVQGVHRGVLFLGHDKMVYYLTQAGPAPVGSPVQKILNSLPDDRLAWVHSRYNPHSGEYWLAIPRDAPRQATEIWVFELKTFLESQKIVWRKRSIAAGCLTVVSSTSESADAAAQFLLLATGAEVFVVKEEDLTYNGVGFVGRWQSRKLNTGSAFLYYTFNSLFIAYESSVDTSIKVRYTGDGGVTWSAEEVLVAVANGETVQARPFITGKDVRFELIFDNSVIRVTGFSANLVPRSLFRG